MPAKPYNLTYPQLGNYDIPIGYLVRQGLGLAYTAPPPMTKHTIDLGAKHSPDYVCAPFKCMMGCYIEALEKGANVIIQTGGTCRLGYYGELHEQILHDLGYDFKILNLTLPRYGGIARMLGGIKKYAPEQKWPQIAKVLPATVKMITSIDKVEDYMRRNMGFEDIPGSFDKVYKHFLSELRKAVTLKDVEDTYKLTMRSFSRLPVHKPDDPVRVGIIGEYFTIMDPFSNHEIEKKIAMMGAEVHRWMNLSHSVLSCPDDNALDMLRSYAHYDLKRFPSSIWVDSQRKKIRKYVSEDMGASSVATIAMADHYASLGYDGLVHVKSFGCTPEMDAIPVLHNVSEDYKIPILYLSYDTQSSDTGIETRAEAFYDMISMRKEAKRS